MIEIKKIETLEDFKKTIPIQQSAWGFPDIETESFHLMTRIQKYGGIVQGLYLDNELVGFTLAIIGKWQGEYFIFSHMAAVKKEYQGCGYGFLLKQAQREEALKMGYHLMRWCFDPLEAQNSFFNIHRLGVVAGEYERDVYGHGESGLFEGLATDRLIACWELQSKRATDRVEQKLPLFIEDVPTEKLSSFHQDIAYIEIPRDIRLLKKSNLAQAEEWRLKTRESFETAFQKGFTAKDIIFSKDKERIFYKLYRD